MLDTACLTASRMFCGRPTAEPEVDYSHPRSIRRISPAPSSRGQIDFDARTIRVLAAIGSRLPKRQQLGQRGTRSSG